MAAGNTYVAIATQTLGSSASTVTFSSIPGTYTDLICICFMKSTATSLERNVLMRFNGDTATNYSQTTVYGENTTPGSYRQSSQTGALVSAATPPSSGSFTTNIVQIQNYSNTTTYKTLLSRWASATQNGATVSLWRATPAAITSIELYLSGDQFPSGSTFSLYGIASA